MKDLKSIQWFLNELPRLQNAGVIDSTAAERLREHYSGELKENSLRGLLFTVLGIFAALLIAGSIILFTAHNWDALPKTGRLLITFIPFLLAALFAGFVLIRGKTGVWLEAAALLLTAAIVTLNALVSQIYHIDGSLFDFLTLNLPFALVLMYLFNSRVLALIVAIALVQFAIGLERQTLVSDSLHDSLDSLCRSASATRLHADPLCRDPRRNRTSLLGGKKYTVPDPACRSRVPVRRIQSAANRKSRLVPRSVASVRIRHSHRLSAHLQYGFAYENL